MQKVCDPEEKKNNPKNNGHYVPAVMPKGSAHTLLRPISIAMNWKLLYGTNSFRDKLGNGRILLYRVIYERLIVAVSEATARIEAQEGMSNIYISHKFDYG